MDERNPLREEDRKVRRLCFLADFVSQMLASPQTTLLEAYGLICFARAHALTLFPDKEEAFEIIYLSRFRRILTERMQHDLSLCN